MLIKSGRYCPPKPGPFNHFVTMCSKSFEKQTVFSEPQDMLLYFDAANHTSVTICFFFHSKICFPPLFLPNFISPATPLFHAGLLAGWRAWKKRIYWGPAWLHPRGGGRMQVKTGIFNDHIQTFSGIFNDQIQTFSQVRSDLCQVLGWSCAL